MGHEVGNWKPLRQEYNYSYGRMAGILARVRQEGRNINTHKAESLACKIKLEILEFHFSWLLERLYSRMKIRINQKNIAKNLQKASNNERPHNSPKFSKNMPNKTVTFPIHDALMDQSQFK